MEKSGKGDRKVSIVRAAWLGLGMSISISMQRSFPLEKIAGSLLYGMMNPAGEVPVPRNMAAPSNRITTGCCPETMWTL